VTAQRQVERNGRVSYRPHAAIVDTSANGIIRKRLDGTIET
jgi:hypothetical protein